MGDKSVLMQCAMWCDLCYFCASLNDSEALRLSNPKRRVIVKFGASVPSNPDIVYGLHAALGDERTILQ